MKDPLPLLFLPDPAFCRGRSREEMARSALQGGAASIQLRAKDLAGNELVEAGRALQRLCREFERPFFVNDRVDVALACGADGVHLGPGDVPPREARKALGPGVLIGVSVYSSLDLKEAEAVGAAYVAVGAVYPTSTKKIDVVGLEGVGRIRGETGLPVVAIGGIRPENASRVIAAGADGLAVVSSLSSAEDIEGATRSFRHLIEAALAERAGL